MVFILLTCLYEIEGTAELVQNEQTENELVQNNSSPLTTTGDESTTTLVTAEQDDTVGSEHIRYSRMADSVTNEVHITSTVSGQGDVENGDISGDTQEEFSGNQLEELSPGSQHTGTPLAEEREQVGDTLQTKLEPFGPPCMVPQDLHEKLTQLTHSTSTIFYMLPEWNVSYSMDEKFGLHKDMECPSATKQYTELEMRSLCPWYYDIHYDSERYPKHIKTAKCMKCRDGCERNPHNIFNLALSSHCQFVIVIVTTLFLYFSS